MDENLPLSNQEITDSSSPKQGKFKLTKIEKFWTFYDAGNSGFVMFLVLIAVTLKGLAAGTPFADNATQTMSNFATISGAVVAVLGPILGAIADNKGKKKPMWFFFVLVGSASCIVGMLVNVVPTAMGQFVFFLILIMLARIGLSGSAIFYDAMLSDITTDKRGDNVSARGFAAGYIWSLVPFFLCLLVYVLTSGIIKIPGTVYDQKLLMIGMTIGSAISGIWWLAFSLPLYKNYVQVTGVEPVKHQIRDAFKKIGITFKELKTHKCALIFLCAFFCYINGVSTIITLSATYATDILTPVYGSGFFLTANLLGALIMTQIVACVFSIIFGRISKKVGTRKLIILSVIGYAIFVIVGVFMNHIAIFWILAFGVGLFQGGIQALSRSYFSRLIPREKQTEFFGLYDIFNKGASFVGTGAYSIVAAVLPAVVYIGGHPVMQQRIGVASLLFFFIAGLILLFILPKNVADNVEQE